MDGICAKKRSNNRRQRTKSEQMKVVGLLFFFLFATDGMQGTLDGMVRLGSRYVHYDDDGLFFFGCFFLNGSDEVQLVRSAWRIMEHTHTQLDTMRGIEDCFFFFLFFFSLWGQAMRII